MPNDDLSLRKDLTLLGYDWGSMDVGSKIQRVGLIMSKYDYSQISAAIDNGSSICWSGNMGKGARIVAAVTSNIVNGAI